MEEPPREHTRVPKLHARSDRVCLPDSPNRAPARDPVSVHDKAQRKRPDRVRAPGDQTQEGKPLVAVFLIEDLKAKWLELVARGSRV